MRLITLTVRNFRGFGSGNVTVTLDADLVLLFGPNGFGKTSLAEAIEWLFYGTTRRRQRGDSYSKNEYDGCFANVHGGVPVEVSAKIRTAGGVEHTITRRIPNPKDDEASVTFIDGNSAALDSLGLINFDAVHPVVAQHDLQSFIHSRPKERRDIISAAFGLDELTALKTALDGARKSFNLSPPAGVEQARARLRPLAPVLVTLPETKAIGQRWQKTPMQVNSEEDIKALISAGKRLAGSTASDLDTLLEALRGHRQHLSQNVFDTSQLIPPADIPGSTTRISTEMRALSAACNTLSDAIVTAIAAATTTYATVLLQFWETGLKFEATDDSCPMCEKPTLTAGKKAELRARLEAAHAALAGNQQVTNATTKANTALTRVTQAMQNVNIQGLTEKDRSLLERLLSTRKAEFSAYVAVHDALISAIGDGHAAAATLVEFLTNISVNLPNATLSSKLVAESKTIPHQLVTAVTKINESLKKYDLAWSAFEPTLSAQISSNKAIVEIDAVGKALKAKRDIQLLNEYDAISGYGLELMQKTEAHLQNKQTQLLKSKGKDIKAIYDQMNPGAEVAFETMEPGNEQLRLHASSFGVQMSAAANLSECQLNCLGLSFWLMRATMSRSPFGFIVLDDPVQSMDDAHCEAFIGTLVPDLCDTHKKQVLILSHERELIDRIRDLNKGRNTAVYHFDDYEKSGPSITQQINLAVMLREVESLAKGNEANRQLSVDKLRRVVEQLVRELHLKQTGQPAPAEYDKAEPSELLNLFKKIPGTLPHESQRLKDTCDFASPAHHQEVGYAPPVTTNIIPHVDRLRTLMKKYKLLL